MKTYNPATDSTISPVAIGGKRKRAEEETEVGQDEEQEEEQLGGWVTGLLFHAVLQVLHVCRATC